MPKLRPAASVAIFDADTVLLIRRAFAPLAGVWTLPGGRAEPGESAETCARREIEEELGLALGVLVYVETRNPPGFSLTVFSARVTPGVAPRPNEEIAGWRWHAPGAPLPVPHTDGLGDVLRRARAALAGFS